MIFVTLVRTVVLMTKGTDITFQNIVTTPLLVYPTIGACVTNVRAAALAPEPDEKRRWQLSVHQEKY